MKYIIIILTTCFLISCATITNDANVPVTLTFSDGSEGSCQISNKRMALTVEIPSTTMVRRSDDALKYDCETSDGRKSFGSIPSTLGGKIVASAVFLDFGIVDSITDKHREYPPNFVLPVKKQKD
tara:strand:- start:207 stop:581 length:375 start_codon:yes stop_codon:yes gene_type:complete